jgi:hypothetical protein
MSDNITVKFIYFITNLGLHSIKDFSAYLGNIHFF